MPPYLYPPRTLHVDFTTGNYNPTFGPALIYSCCCRVICHLLDVVLERWIQVYGCCGYVYLPLYEFTRDAFTLDTLRCCYCCSRLIVDPFTDVVAFPVVVVVALRYPDSTLPRCTLVTLRLGCCPVGLRRWCCTLVTF